MLLVAELTANLSMRAASVANAPSLQLYPVRNSLLENFLPKYKIWGWNFPFCGNLGAKLNFWAPSVGNLQLSVEKLQLSAPIPHTFLNHDATVQHTGINRLLSRAQVWLLVLKFLEWTESISQLSHTQFPRRCLSIGLKFTSTICNTKRLFSPFASEKH